MVISVGGKPIRLEPVRNLDGPWLTVTAPRTDRVVMNGREILCESVPRRRMEFHPIYFVEVVPL